MFFSSHGHPQNPMLTVLSVWYTPLVQKNVNDKRISISKGLPKTLTDKVGKIVWKTWCGNTEYVWFGKHLGQFVNQRKVEWNNLFCCMSRGAITQNFSHCLVWHMKVS